MSTRARARTAVPKIVLPRRLPGEVPWVPAFHYECERGHWIASDSECCACPACTDGVPCDGALRRVGPHGGALRT